MNIAIGCDHGGYELKNIILAKLKESGYSPIDCGAYVLEPGDDYPVFSKKVGEAIQQNRAERGILICGSGVGASFAVNKMTGIRAALCHETFSAHQGVEDDNMNVICLGGRVIGPALAWEIVNTFLEAKFSEAPRHLRRLAEVDEMEQKRTDFP